MTIIGAAILNRVTLVGRDDIWFGTYYNGDLFEL